MFFSREMEEKYRIVIHFLVKRGFQNNQIFNQMNDVYGRGCISLRTIERWAGKFRKGDDDTMDKPRSGRPKRSDLADSITSLLQEYPFYSAKMI